MEEHLKIDSDKNLSQLFLEEEIQFKGKDPTISISRQAKSTSFTLKSKTQKTIDRTRKSLQNIPLIYQKIISIQ